MIKIYAVTPKVGRQGDIITSTLYLVNDENSNGTIMFNADRDVIKFFENHAEFCRVDFTEIHSNDPDAILAVLKEEGYEFK